MLRRSLVLAGTAALVLAVLVPGAGARSAATPAYPVTITAGNGKITIRQAPRRIVSLSPTSTESLFAIGAGSQVIAVDDQSDYPKSAPKTTLSGFTPNVEAVASYRPDLVIIGFDPRGFSDALSKLGIPVVVHNAVKNLAGAYQQIRQLGRITGREAGAAAVVARMKQQIGKIVAASKQRAAGLTVYHELTPDFYSASSGSFVGTVYKMLGLGNIADAADTGGSGFPQLSAEYIVSSSPDVIVLADVICCGQKPSTVAARPGWGSIKAVRSGSIVRMDDSIASRWGPRLVNFFRAVSTALARLKA